MSVGTGRTKLMRSLRELNVHWEEISEKWDDPVRREFESRYVEPLDSLTRSAVAAIEHITIVMHNARGDCT